MLTHVCGALQRAAGSPAPLVRPTPRRTSRFRGVCWNKKNKRWQASINVGGKYMYLGSFQKEEHAAKAFDLQAFSVRQEKAKLNFPECKVCKRYTAAALLAASVACGMRGKSAA